MDKENTVCVLNLYTSILMTDTIRAGQPRVFCDPTTRLYLMTTTSHILILLFDFGLWTVEEWSNGLLPPLGTQIKIIKQLANM